MAALQDKEFILLSRAKDLIKHTLTMTDNAKRYPKKYRFTFVNRMQGLAIDIYEHINTANELNVLNKEELKERLQYQNKALTKCKTLLFLIDLSLEYKNIVLDSRQAQAWARYVLDVKNMTVKWYSKDKERLKG